MTYDGVFATSQQGPYTGLVLPGHENDGLATPVFQGLTAPSGLRIDGNPADSGFSAWWEWELYGGPLPAGCYLAYDIQWTSDANYVIVQMLGDGVPFANNEFNMGPRSYWGGSWHPQDLQGQPLPAGITKLRYGMSASNSSFGYALSAIFQRMKIYQVAPGVLSGGASYNTGDVVRHNGATWIAVMGAEPGNEPGVSPVWVQIARDGMNFAGDWASDT